MSFTLTLRNKSDQLRDDLFPPLTGGWKVGLVYFEAFNTISNLPDTQITIGDVTVPISEGTYKISDLEDLIVTALAESNDVHFELKGNNNTSLCEMMSNREVVLSPELSILLGFNTTKFPASEKVYISDKCIDLTPSSIRIDVNVAKGAYFKGTRTHTIRTVSPVVPPGYKIIDTPQTVIYHDTIADTISHVEVTLLDVHGRTLNFKKEVTVELHFIQKS